MVEVVTLAGAALSRSPAGAGTLDEGAFTAVYEGTAVPLRAYLRRICGDPAAADDLLQETFLRFCRARPEMTSERETRAYLFRVATNLATDRWRRSARSGKAVPAEEADHVAAGPKLLPGAEEASHLRRRDVERVFGLLVPRERAMLWLAYVEGCNHAEIADRIGAGRRSVRVLLFRARRKLARLLVERGLGPEGTS